MATKMIKIGLSPLLTSCGAGVGAPQGWTDSRAAPPDAQKMLDEVVNGLGQVYVGFAGSVARKVLPS